MEIKKGMSLTDLLELAKHSEQHKQLFYGLALVDKTMQDLVKNIMLSEIQEDIDEYYIKTDIMNQCYSLYVFNKVRQITIGVSWTLADFLLLCSNKQINIEIELKVKQIIKKFNEKGLSVGRINWIY